MTSTAEKSIDVELPVSAVYALWTDFENFPRFMHNVDSVVVTSPGALRWKATIAGVTREWDARVTEELEDERIAWTATEGATNAGVVTFHRISDTTTRVMLQLEFEPDGFVETVGDKLGMVTAGAESDLERFKAYAEEKYAKEGGFAGTTTGNLTSATPTYSTQDERTAATL